MAERIFKGKNETITYGEADALAESAQVQLLYYMHELAKEATDDEEELSNIEVNLAKYVGAYGNACTLKGVLADTDVYLSSFGFPEGVTVSIEEVGGTER